MGINQHSGIEKWQNTPTTLVAANNAPAGVKARADYVCDGVADDAEIQAAITAVGTGGVVQLTEGNFSVDNSIILNCVGLIGAGQSATTITANVNGFTIVDLRQGNATVTNLGFNGNNLSDCEAIVFDSTGGSSPDQVQITGCRFNDFASGTSGYVIQAINSSTYQTARITNNIFSNCYAGWVLCTDALGWVISDNTITNSTAATGLPAGIHGISLSGGSNNLIASNTIRVTGTSTLSSTTYVINAGGANVSVSNNVIKLNQYGSSGITYSSVSGGAIIGNIIDECSNTNGHDTPAVRLGGCENLTVVGNVFIGSGVFPSIGLIGSTPDLEASTIVGNQFRNFAAATSITAGTLANVVANNGDQP